MSTTSDKPDHDNPRVKLAELIQDIRVAMLTTFDPDGTPHVRPMWTQTLDPKTFDGLLWFMTSEDSSIVPELSFKQDVLLTYAAPDKNRYVAVTGTGHVKHDPAKAKELWNVHGKGWFPDGPDDPKLMLIKVEVESAEYWDGPSNTSYILSLLKAVVTRSQVRAKSDHGKL